MFDIYMQDKSSMVINLPKIIYIPPCDKEWRRKRRENRIWSDEQREREGERERINGQKVDK